MKKYSISLLICLGSFLLHAQKVFVVKNADEFISVLQPDCEILMTAPNIIISDLKPVNNKYFEVTEDMGNSRLVIKGIYNLTLSGTGKDSSCFISSTADQPVIEFDSCRDIVIKNLMIAHGPDKGELCTAASILFTRCERIRIDSCYLFGSGTYGIITTKFTENKFGVKDLKVSNTIIGSCTHGFIDIEEGSNVFFSKCTFIDNHGGAVIENSSNISFHGCLFSFNKYIPDQPSTKDGLYISYLIDVKNSEKISFGSCKIINNAFGFLIYAFDTAEGIFASEFSNNFFKHGLSIKE